MVMPAFERATPSRLSRLLHGQTPVGHFLMQCMLAHFAKPFLLPTEPACVGLLRGIVWFPEQGLVANPPVQAKRVVNEVLFKIRIRMRSSEQTGQFVDALIGVQAVLDQFQQFPSGRMNKRAALVPQNELQTRLRIDKE